MEGERCLRHGSSRFMTDADFSHWRQNCYCGLQSIYSSMALKSGGPCTFGPPTARKWGLGPQDSHRIAATGAVELFMQWAITWFVYAF